MSAHSRIPEFDEQSVPATIAGTSSGNAERDFSALDLVILLAERKRWVFWITVSFTLGALLLSFIVPQRYSAEVAVLPPQQGSSAAAALAGQLGSAGIAALAGGALGIKNPNDMFIGMLRSRTVEEAMVQRFGLMQEYHKRYLSDARKTFERRVGIDGSGKDGFIHITVRDPDPIRAAELANGYVEQLRSLSEHLAISEASQRRLFFERQLRDAKDNLARSEEELKVTEQRTGMIQLDSQARALIESAAVLRAQIESKEVQIESLRTFATDENSQLVQARQELESLKVQLARLGGSEGSGDGGLVLPRGKISQAGLEYVRKLRDVKYYEAIFGILARQFELAKLDEAKQGALIQVVDSATPPDKRSFPKRTVFLIVGFLLGVVVAVAISIVRTSFEGMHSDPEASTKIERLRRSIGLRTRMRPVGGA